MTRPPPEAFDAERSNRDVEAVLAELVRAAGADSAVLVHGPAASVVQAVGGFSSYGTVPALADACLTSAGRLASLVADVEFTSLAHRGDGSTILLREVTGGWILMLVLREPVTWTSDPVEAAVAELRRIAGIDPMRTSGAGQSQGVDPEWIAAAETEIDRIFGEE